MVVSVPYWEWEALEKKWPKKFESFWNPSEDEAIKNVKYYVICNQIFNVELKK